MEVPPPVVVAQVTPVPQPLSKPQVLAEPEPVAKAEPVKPVKPLEVEVLSPDGVPVDKSRIVAMPAPPRRPTNLPAPEPQLAYAKVPVPPQRPVEFAALSPKAAARDFNAEAPETPVVVADLPGEADKASLTRSIAAAATVPVPPAPLPRVIVDGGQKTVGANAALAFAAHTLQEPPQRPVPLAMVPVPPRRPDFVPAKLDRSNFRLLTAPLPTAKAQHSASVMQPMRASIKTNALAYMTLPESGVATSFGATPTGDLRADAFTGPAIRPFATAGAYVEIPTGSIDNPAQ